MASLKEIKSRINSVNGTLKITSAMKMVASSKLHKAQNAIANMLPYEKQMHNILYRLLSDDSVPVCGEYITQRPCRKVAIVAVSSNSALCGAFNSNVIKHFHETAAEYLSAGLRKEDILVYGLGRKIADAASKAGYAPMGDFNRLEDKYIYSEAADFARMLIDKFLKREIDKIELVYTHCRSTSVQVPVRETYLPFSAQEPSDDREDSDQDDSGYMKDYIVEPDAESVLRDLLPKVLVLKIYTMLLDANAAEHAARTVAMQEATDNGNQLLQDLTLQYNKQRQQSITDELLDIVSGSLA